MILLYRVLFVCLALLGGFILFRVIPVIAKIVTEKPIASLPLNRDAVIIEIPAAGEYSVWQKGSGFTRTRVDIGLPVIAQVSSGKRLPLNRTAGMLTANDGSGTRRQLYTFSVPEPGNYRVELPADAAASRDTSSYSLEIRKPMPAFRLVISILAIIAGFAAMVGGIIGIVLAERLT